MPEVAGGGTLGVRGDRGGVGHGKCRSKILATSSTPAKKHNIPLKITTIIPSLSQIQKNVGFQ